MQRKSLASVVILTLLAQSTGAASLLLLPLLGSRIADIYAAAAQVGLIGYAGVILGVLYNLALGRPRFAHWRLWGSLGALATIAGGIFQYVALTQSGFIQTGDSETEAIALITFAVGGALIAACGPIAVRRACQSKPRMLVSMTILPNAGALLGVGAAVLTGDANLIGFSWLVLCAVNLILVFWIDRRDVPQASIVLEQTGNDSGRKAGSLRIQAIALSLGVVTSTFLPLVFVAAVSQLESGAVFVATFTMRIVTALNGLLVNSALIVKYNWGSSSGDVRSLVTAIVLVFSLAGAVGVAATVLYPETPSGFIACALAMTFSLAGSAITVREMNAKAMSAVLLVKTIIDFALAALAALYLFANPSLVGYLGAYALSLSLTALIGGSAFRSRRMIAVGTSAVMISIAMLTLGPS